MLLLSVPIGLELFGFAWLLTVAFLTGVAAVFFQIAYTATTVTLTLYVGGNPKQAGRPCPDYVAATAVDTTLKTPLGGRQLLDGSATGADNGHRPVITSQSRTPSARARC